MGNTITCDGCQNQLNGVVWDQSLECEVESNVMVWTNNNNPGTDYCLQCIEKNENLITNDFKLMSVYKRCGIANARHIKNDLN